MESVRIEIVQPQRLAVISRTSSRETLAADIFGALDVIWPELRRQGVQTGRNVVVYRGGLEAIDVGVEVPAGFTPNSDIREATTPGGEVATAAHYGDYSGLHGAYDEIEALIARTGRKKAGTSWEVYGHWTDNAAELRTDVYLLLLPAPKGRAGEG